MGNSVSIIHHIALTCSNLHKSSVFFDGLLGSLGFERAFSGESVFGWEGHGLEVLLYQGHTTFSDDEPYDRYQRGFHHLALQVQTTAEVDAVFQWASSAGVEVLDPPAHYPDYPGNYYALFLADPDGLKFEVMCN